MKKIKNKEITGKKIDLLTKELAKQNDEFTITFSIGEKLYNKDCVVVSYKHEELSELQEEFRWKIERYFVININEPDESFVEIGVSFYKDFKTFCELAYTTL
jgi:hypothetical protein